MTRLTASVERELFEAPQSRTTATSISASHCEAAEGLITEAEDYLDGDGNRDVLDAGLVTAAQRFEHYEIAAYGSAISFSPGS